MRLFSWRIFNHMRTERAVQWWTTMNVLLGNPLPSLNEPVKNSRAAASESPLTFLKNIFYAFFFCRHLSELIFRSVNFIQKCASRLRGKFGSILLAGLLLHFVLMRCKDRWRNFLFRLVVLPLPTCVPWNWGQEIEWVNLKGLLFCACYQALYVLSLNSTPWCSVYDVYIPYKKKHIYFHIREDMFIWNLAVCEAIHTSLNTMRSTPRQEEYS